MICIFTNVIDHSATDVIRWLHYLGRKDVIRINYNDPHSAGRIQIDVSNGTFFFQYNNQQIYLNDIDAVWYRKGKSWLCDQFYPVTIDGHSKFTEYMNKKLQSEEARLSEYIHYIIEHTVPVIGSSMKGNLNKLLVLRAAEEVGFLIPDFYIFNFREGAWNVYNQFPGLITKSMSDGVYLFENTESETGYFSYTEKVTKDWIAALPDRFSPSFVQDRIDKKFELRIFYLDGKCYSMAILSQSDEQTKVDFRKYNNEKPNRCVPFKLPRDIEKKIQRLFKKLELNTGSVDLIIDKNDKFFFLEINPVGEFLMVSLPCNYYLENQIALKLVENANGYREKQTSPC